MIKEKATVIHKSLLKPKAPKKITTNFKVTPEELSEIKAIAEKYTKGNVTALIKIAVKSFKPLKRDLVKIR